MTTTDTNNPENVSHDRTSSVSTEKTDNGSKSSENDDDEKNNTLDDLDEDEEEMRVCQSFDL